jgi:asparagine synthase (glutamine-hydrolysing)
MCGINGYFSARGASDSDGLDYGALFESTNKIQYRGPDQTEVVISQDEYYSYFLGFHRLNIIGDEDGRQPFIQKGCILMCNGEIYNYKQLIEQYELDVKTTSDCEVILHLYKRLGIQETIKVLDGVFAFCLYDTTTNDIHLGRDVYGVRPLFYCISVCDLQFVFQFASEMKSIIHIKNTHEYPAFSDELDIKHVPPSSYITVSSTGTNVYTYHNILQTTPSIDCINQEFMYSQLRLLLRNAVIKRLHANRPIGFMLSGGLDSTLVLSIAADYYFGGECKTPPDKIHVFSIGNGAESPDLKYAAYCMEFLNDRWGADKFDFHVVPFDTESMFKQLPDLIYCLETYDTTTIRASSPMWVLSEYIYKNTDVRVIMSGEGSDELLGGYLYFHYAPTDKEWYDETKRLLSELYLYDVLRSDRSTASNGLEVRVPFLDINFTKWVLSLPTAMLRAQSHNVEKYTLRKAFDSVDWVDKRVLWRQKEAFSDAVGMSYQNRIKQFVDAYYYTNDSVATKERMYYKELYNSWFLCECPTNQLWLPRWVDVGDEPSATVLDIHSTLAL